MRKGTVISHSTIATDMLVHVYTNTTIIANSLGEGTFALGTVQFHVVDLAFATAVSNFHARRTEINIRWYFVAKCTMYRHYIFLFFTFL
jgi:hypothetical protein